MLSRPAGRMVDVHSGKERAMHRILPIVLFAVAALGLSACQDTETGASAGIHPSSEASPAALNYDLPDNTVLEGKE